MSDRSEGVLGVVAGVAVGALAALAGTALRRGSEAPKQEVKVEVRQETRRREPVYYTDEPDGLIVALLIVWIGILTGCLMLIVASLFPLDDGYDNPKPSSLDRAHVTYTYDIALRRYAAEARRLEIREEIDRIEQEQDTTPEGPR